MSAIDILNNGVRSLTGGITKAYIKFEDERIKAKDIKVTDVNARAAAVSPGLPGAGKLQAVATKVANGTNSAANAIGGLMAGVGVSGFSSGNVYEVKFNPSDISFQAYGGAKVQKMNYAEGGNVQMDFVDMAPRIMMNVSLVFDDYERTDAFMTEKFSDLMALTRTGVTSAANAVTGKIYSVRPQVEGFIGSLRNEKTRKMSFFWGNMHYKGFLETIGAEYTMFNMEGHPIRANVNLGILLVDENIKDNDMGYWSESYKKAFEKNSSLRSKVGDGGNLLNIKL